MTIDDDNSVYVGNLPYDATEDTIRRVFDLYGQIIAVKMVNDRGVGGKCFAFVTFTNPRCAEDAISDMNGRTIGGRVVKVNEVKSRSGRSNFGRDNFRRNIDRDVELERGRVRDADRDYDRARDRSHDQNREWSEDRDQGKERAYDRARDIDRNRDPFIDRDRGHDGDKILDLIEHERERDRDQQDKGQEKEIRRSVVHHRSGNKYKDQMSKLSNGSDSSERHSRDYQSGSSRGDHDQVSKKLDVSHQKMEELQNEVYHMEQLLKERGDHVSKLQEKSQKLEDALASAKKLTLKRRKQLVKLHKCFLNMKEYGEKLRSCEEELQSLVGSTLKELDNHNEFATDGLLAS
uniref:ATP-dependent RNA helicase DHX8 isoform X2 n=1 Tax=Erigeron canadensis TaxID=72917 RepID=UPI001CB973FD|nr:ATP-dependent RNA helicase DHX8 isoform X2 [Erigeron canadensis]